MHKTNRILDLARLMIKQAILLKRQGMTAEARELAMRAISMNSLGHHAMRLQPVRSRAR